MYNHIPQISIPNNPEGTARISSFMAQVMADFDRLYVSSDKPIRDIKLILDDIKELSDQDKKTFSKFTGNYSKLFEPRIFINMPFSVRDKFIFWDAQGFKDAYLLHSFVRNEIKKPEQRTTENISIFKELIDKTNIYKNDRTSAFSEFFAEWINNKTPDKTDNAVLLKILHQIPMQPSVFFEELASQYIKNPEKKDLYLKKTKDILKQNNSYLSDFKKAFNNFQSDYPNKAKELSNFISETMITEVSSKREIFPQIMPTHCR